MRGFGKKIVLMQILLCSFKLYAQLLHEIFLVVNNTMLQIAVERPVYRLDMRKKVKRELMVQHVRPGKGKFIDVWFNSNDGTIPIKIYNNYETITDFFLMSQERLIVVRDGRNSYTGIMRKKNEKIERLRNKL
ncbi:MAG: hypothetical protein BWY54_00770 [Candidatus Dependentiae bacterium ADurb.Bin331]|nr:MAG: hypothetical protein BWY54_00770 [Candidatus Dependentiae bacterium ADurb.Bin331]